MTPHLDSEIRPQNDMTSTQLVSHTSLYFRQRNTGCCRFVKRDQQQNCSGHFRVSSSLKDLQCIAVCEVDVSSVIQNKYHSPAEWAGCRVTDSHPQRTNHAGRLLLLTGAPGCPTGSTTGLLQWDSLQRSLVHGSGRLPTALLR